MVKICDKFKDCIDTLLEDHDAIFFDNVFPNLINDFFEKPFISKEEIRDYTRANDYLTELLKKNQRSLFVPYKIFQQFQKGKIIENKVFEKSRKKYSLKKELSDYIISNVYLMDAIRKNVYSLDPKLQDDFYNCFKYVLNTSRSWNLKKADHKDDGFADELLVSTALFHSENTGSRSAIITNDRDILDIVKSNMKKEAYQYGMDSLYDRVTAYFLDNFYRRDKDYTAPLYSTNKGFSKGQVSAL